MIILIIIMYKRACCSLEMIIHQNIHFDWEQSWYTKTAVSNNYIPLISRVWSPYGKLWTEFFSFVLWPKGEARGPWKQGRKKQGSITCRTDRANEANKMFIIWLCWLFRFWKSDRELEVRTATYGPGIDQSQHAKSVSHIIKNNFLCVCTNRQTPEPYSLFSNDNCSRQSHTRMG